MAARTTRYVENVTRDMDDFPGLVAGNMDGVVGFFVVSRLLPSLRLRFYGFGEKPHVFDRAREREDERDVNECAADIDEVDDAHVDEPERQMVRKSDDEAENSNHLKSRLALSAFTRGDHDAFAARDRPEAGHRDFSSDEENDRPLGDPSHRHHPNERG